MIAPPARPRALPQLSAQGGDAQLAGLPEADSEVHRLRREVQELMRRNSELESQMAACPSGEAVLGGFATPGDDESVGHTRDIASPTTPQAQESTQQQQDDAGAAEDAARGQAAEAAAALMVESVPQPVQLVVQAAAGVAATSAAADRQAADRQAEISREEQEEEEVILEFPREAGFPAAECMEEVVLQELMAAADRGSGSASSLETVLAKLRDTDIPKLEFTKGAPKAAAFEKWLQRASLRIGGWHRAIEAYWARAQEVTAAAYDDYLQLGPMQRPMVRPAADWVQPEQIGIELKLRPILLEAVPESVRQAALNTRATSVVDVLFATMVEAGPGTLQDQKLTLKAVELREHQHGGPQVQDVFDSLQRWKFDLTRLQRLGMAAPDPTVQADTLRQMVQRMAAADSAFQYRLHAFQMNHGLFGMLSQAQVDEFWRYLSAEAREAHGQEPAPTAKSVSERVAAIEGRAKGKDSERPNSCRFFESDAGCKQGGACTWPHRKLLASEGKCFNCGSKEHSKDACTRPKREAAAKAAEVATKPGGSSASAADPGGAGTQTQPASQAGQLGSVVAATIKALAGEGLPGAALAVAPVDADPGWLDRWATSLAPAAGPRAAVAVARLGKVGGKRMLLADTGATHELRSIPVGGDPGVESRRVDLQTATGSMEARMGEDDVVYVESDTPLQPLFPLGIYIEECGLGLEWMPEACTLRLPDHRSLELQRVEGSMYIAEDDAEVLRQLRAALRLARGRATVAQAIKAAVSLTELAKHRAEGHPTFMAECRECRLAAGRMRPHYRLDPATRPGGQLSADLSGPHPPGRWPSSLQEDAPRRAQYFLLCAYQVMTRAEVTQQGRNIADARAAAPASDAELFDVPGGLSGNISGSAADGDARAELDDSEARVWYFTVPLERKTAEECIRGLDAVVAAIGLVFQGQAVFRIHAAFGDPVTARAKDPPKASFAARGKEMIFLGAEDHTSGGYLLGRKARGARKGEEWSFEVSSSFVIDVSAVLPDTALGDAGGGANGAGGGGDDIFQLPAEERFFSCPACRGRHRSHTRDARCRLGPAAGVAAVAGLPVSLLHHHDTIRSRVPLAAAAGVLTETEANEEQEEDADLPVFQHVFKESGLAPATVREVDQSFGAEREAWRQALSGELESLRGKGAFETLSAAEVASTPARKVLPMKMVLGTKPRSEAEGGGRKHKARGCICGNFQPQTPGEETFSAAVDVASLRLVLAVAAANKWACSALDVATAFLNAELPPEAGEVIVRPLSILARFGLVQAGALWRVKQAIYGLRVAPRAWVEKRDRTLREKVIMVEGERSQLRQSQVDQCLWAIVNQQDRVMGYVCVYVDDFLIVGETAAIRAVSDMLESTWTCSVQSLISPVHPGSIKYLSLSIQARADGYYVHQQEYLEELLAKWGLDRGNGAGTIVIDPLPEQIADGDEEEEEAVDIGQVRLAQRMPGGLLWLSSRTRPDVAFAVSRLASAAAVHPEWALKLGKKILRHLAGTRHYGLACQCSGGMALHVYADASFEPATAQTGIANYLGPRLVDWRSCTQPQPARPTAEAEVKGLALGGVVLEGVEAVLGSMLIEAESPKTFGDSQASIHMFKGQGSWRTRCLANRAAALRARIKAGLLFLGFVASAEQKADGLTKTFSVPMMGQ
ncbi:unnamed protein product, partial [Prorocentrum cordatum]